MRYVAIVLCFFCFAPCEAQTFSDRDFQQLHQLIGRWKMTTARGEIWEQWELRNGMLYGTSFRIRDKDTTWLEQIDLLFDNGGIFYKPVVANQNNGQRVSFALNRISANTFQFENLLHDFPQRIIYDFSVPDSIYARIEGNSKGQFRTSQYRYARIKH